MDIRHAIDCSPYFHMTYHRHWFTMRRSIEVEEVIYVEDLLNETKLMHFWLRCMHANFHFSKVAPLSCG